MNPSSNPFIALLDLFRSPIACFSALHQRPLWGVFPYIITLLGSFLIWGAYFDHVNFQWLSQTMVSQFTNGKQTLDPSWLSKEVLLAGEVFSDIMGRTACLFVLALWLRLATKQSQLQHSYAKWLAAACFISLPSIIGDVASYINILFNHTPMLPTWADLNSLNAFIKLPLNSIWSPFITATPILMPWYIALTYAVICTWTDFNRAKAIVIAVLPWVMIIIGWPLMTLTL